MMAEKHTHRIRTLARVGIALLGGLATLVVVVVVLLLLAPVRARLLSEAIRIANVALPGELHVSKPTWPSLGSIDLAGVSWTDDADSLAVAARLHVSFVLRPLLSRDLDVSNLFVEDLAVDVPAILQRFPSDTIRSADTGGSAPGFPRPGTLRGVPSVAVRHVDITATSVRLPGTEIRRAHLVGALDVRHGAESYIAIDTLAAVGPSGTWVLDALALHVDPSRAIADGRATGSVAPDVPAELRLAVEDADRFDVQVLSGSKVIVKATGTLHREGLACNGVDFAAEVHAPATPELASVPGMAWYESASPVHGTGIEARGSVQWSPELVTRVSCNVLENNLGLDAASFDLAYEDDILTVDDLAVTASDATLGGSARLEGDALTLRTSVAARGLHTAIAADILLGDTITAHLAPIVIDDVPVPLSSPDASNRGAIRYVTASGSASARHLIVKKNDVRVELDVDVDPVAPDGFGVACGFAATLADTTPLGELAPLLGELEATLGKSDNGLEVAGTLDLTATSWIDSSRIAFSFQDGRAAVRRLQFAALGVSTDVSGAWQSDSVEVSGHVAVSDAKLIQRVVPSAPQITFSAYGSVQGPLSALAGDVSFEGSVVGEDYEVPSLRGAATQDSTHLEIRVHAPAGVRAPHVTLDSLAVVARSLSRSANLPADIEINAWSERYGLHQSMRIDSARGWTAEVQALRARVAGESISQKRPFIVRWMPASRRVEVEDLDLAGTLGNVQLQGIAAPDTIDVTAEVSIQLPEEAPSLDIPAHLWPEGVDAKLRVTKRSARAAITVTGFELPDGRPATLQLDAHSGGDTAAAAVSLRDSSVVVADIRVRLPASMSTYPPAFDMRDDSLRVRMALDGLPLAFYVLRRGAPVPTEQIARLDGTLEVAGTPRAPTGRTRLSLAFPDWPKISAYSLTVDGALGAGAPPQSSADLSRAFDELGSSGIAATLELKRESSKLLTAEVAYPLLVSLDPPSAAHAEGAGQYLKVESGEVPLAELDPLLPFNIGLGGTCRLDLSAEGPVGDATLQGRFVARALEASVAKRATVTAGADIAITGTTRHPRIGGEVNVTSALIQVPEQIKQLHPVNGDALLLNDRTLAAIDVDTTAVVADTVTARSPRTADVDIAIHIPSGFYIRGRGLDLELQGELHVSKSITSPTVVGELRVLKGTLLLLGRSLKLERGTVTFYGQDEVNPTMDVVLAAEIDGTRITITIGGTAQEPELTLASVPEMDEGDIVSILLFGRAFDDLSDDQAGLVEDRMAEMVTALGAAAVRKNVSAVDVVSYQGSGTGERASTLTVGKYISPDVLLSYIYSIEDPQAESFVSLEYFLTGRFKVDTVLGKKSQAGIGIGWTRDY